MFGAFSQSGFPTPWIDKASCLLCEGKFLAVSVVRGSASMNRNNTPTLCDATVRINKRLCGTPFAD